MYEIPGNKNQLKPWWKRKVWGSVSVSTFSVSG